MASILQPFGQMKPLLNSFSKGPILRMNHVIKKRRRNKMNWSKCLCLPYRVRVGLLPALAILLSFLLSGSSSAQPLTSDDRPAIPEFNGVIVDDLSEGFSLQGPERYWKEEAQGYAGHSWWTLNNAEGVDNTARWTLSLPEPGSYDLYVFITATRASTRQANYLIFNNGQTSYVRVDQFAHRNSWYLLGTFNFNAVEEVYVELSDETGEADLQFEIAFDAIGYSRRAPSFEDQISDKIWEGMQPWLDEQSEKLQSRLNEWLQAQKGKLLRQLADIAKSWIDQQCSSMGAAMLLPLFALILWRRGQSKS